MQILALQNETLYFFTSSWRFIDCQNISFRKKTKR